MAEKKNNVIETQADAESLLIRFKELLADSLAETAVNKIGLTAAVAALSEAVQVANVLNAHPQFTLADPDTGMSGNLPTLVRHYTGGHVAGPAAIRAFRKARKVGR